MRLSLQKFLVGAFVVLVMSVLNAFIHPSSLSSAYTWVTSAFAVVVACLVVRMVFRGRR